ncbi:MAG TPA: hypothetical protein PKB15_03495 [Acidimicrobiia bacterium]|nr:hypothetical protein [Acidimicrobiia bacterium]
MDVQQAFFNTYRQHFPWSQGEQIIIAKESSSHTQNGSRVTIAPLKPWGIYWRLSELTARQDALNVYTQDFPERAAYESELHILIVNYVEMAATLIRFPHLDKEEAIEFADTFAGKHKELLLRHFPGTDGLKLFVQKTENSELAKFAGVLLVGALLDELDEGLSGSERLRTGNGQSSESPHANFFRAIADLDIPGMWNCYFTEMQIIRNSEEHTDELGTWQWYVAQGFAEYLGPLFSNEEFRSVVISSGKAPTFKEVASIASASDAAAYFVGLVSSSQARQKMINVMADLVAYIEQVAPSNEMATRRQEELLEVLVSVQSDGQSQEDFVSRFVRELNARSADGADSVLARGVAPEDVANFLFTKGTNDKEGQVALSFVRELYAASDGNAFTEEFTDIVNHIQVGLLALSIEVGAPISR